MSRAEEAVKQAMGWNDKQLEVYKKMGAIVGAMNDISMEDLAQMSQEIAKDEAIGPLLHPEVWRDGKFDEATMVKTVVRAIIDFKKAVSGIGPFHKIETYAKKD